MHNIAIIKELAIGKMILLTKIALGKKRPNISIKKG